MTPITRNDPVCFGTVCPKHAQCVRYHRVDGATTEERIASCQDAEGKRPLFVPVRTEQ